MKNSTKAWIEFAERDLAAAEKLISDEYLANIVLFHSQQCTEKCFKAILEEFDLDVPKIHSVNRLYSLITESTDADLPISDDELDLIDDVYIDTRYPGNLALLPSGFPDTDQAVILFRIAEKVLRAVKDFIS